MKHQVFGRQEAMLKFKQHVANETSGVRTPGGDGDIISVASRADTLSSLSTPALEMEF